jgi:hypothetical protein
MLTAKLMEPAANALEGVQVATLEEGRIHANVFRFSGVPGYGFRLWRWTKFRDGWKRSQLLQAGDIEPIESVLSRLEELTTPLESAAEPKVVAFLPKDYTPQNVVATLESGNVRLYISDPQKPPPAAPFFVLRRTLAGTARSNESGNWFYTVELQDLEHVLREARQWFQSQ